MIETLETVVLEELAGEHAGDVLVLTVNNRHARRVLAELSASLSGARRVMAVPDIVPLSAWLRRTADQLSFIEGSGLAAHTVDAFGSQLLWQRVIAEAESDRALLDVAQAARLAADADRLLDDWRINVLPEVETSDYQRFSLWRDRYRAVLEELDMEDANLAYEHIYAALREDLLEPTCGTIVLAGFNELSPRLQGILEVLRDQGVRVLALARPSTPAGMVQRVMAADPDSEWRLAAQWAATQLAQNPQGRFAIVASRLEADVALAHRCLRAALGGEASGAAASGRPAPYNVAVAPAIADWPLARAAIAWLRVLAEFSHGNYCEPADLGQALLAGGCIAHRQEASGRASIDALWRRQARIRISAAEFSRQLDQHAPQLGKGWRSCQEQVAGQTGQATMDVWVGRFRLWLQALGFPGQATLDSHAYQLLEALDDLMSRLAGQAVVAGRVGMSRAVGLLQRLARETTFQPQRDPDARLDVLGFLESEGGRWDGVWVLGLTDEVLPAVARPNPFIPLAALRQANAPRATPERELQWARTLYAALLESAPAVWLSHARHEGEREMRPSPCIAGLEPQEPSLALPAARPCALEQVVDEQGPPLLAGTTTRGGIAVIDTQARNPLWAFVKYRLGASSLQPYADIADQNARGLLLHRAIELVWSLIPDQQGLRELHVEGRLIALLEQVVQQAADECLMDYSTTLRRLETGRAMGILEKWLMLELAREPFRIKDVEQTYQWSHGPLELSLRLDRIDELSDGRLAVIDYKSGNGSIDPKPDWMRERPVGLQLPFYASVLAQGTTDVAALVLARLHARELATRGLADGDYGFPGVAALKEWPAFADYSWPQLMAEWRQTIEGLATEFASGMARNHSLRADDLQYCDVLPFLRLTEDYQRVE